jgi:shikimate kinase/3-dehydroquinate synthase
MKHVDLDSEVEKTAGRTIADIFAAEGEVAFRRMERDALRRVSAGRNQVVALGGGALLDEDSRRLAESTGRVVFIDCPLPVLLERVAKSCARPLLAGDAERNLRALLGARREHYRSFAERIGAL